MLCIGSIQAGPAGTNMRINFLSILLITLSAVQAFPVPADADSARRSEASDPHALGLHPQLASSHFITKRTKDPPDYVRRIQQERELKKEVETRMCKDGQKIGSFRQLYDTQVHLAEQGEIGKKIEANKDSSAPFWVEKVEGASREHKDDFQRLLIRLAGEKRLETWWKGITAPGFIVYWKTSRPGAPAAGTEAQTH